MIPDPVREVGPKRSQLTGIGQGDRQQSEKKHGRSSGANNSREGGILEEIDMIDDNSIQYR